MARAASAPKKEISMEEALWKSADKLRGSVEPTLSTTDALHGSLLIRQRFGKLKIIMTAVLLKVQMSIRLRKARRRLLILMRSSVIPTDFTQLRRTSLTTMRPALPKELPLQEKQCLSALIARLHTLFIRL